ncbi:MAG TPA: four helix bundle protein [Pirellulales bacterium]|nr:four helix bundle protein [Pirellulales bacterium]
MMQKQYAGSDQRDAVGVKQRIERFEDLIAWQKARKLAAEVYRATSSGPIARDFELRGQLRDAAVSTMSNIAEGYERGSDNEFHYFLGISKASCAELRSELYVAWDVGYFSETRFRDLYSQALEVGRVVSGLRASVDRRRKAKNTSRTRQPHT